MTRQKRATLLFYLDRYECRARLPTWSDLQQLHGWRTSTPVYEHVTMLAAEGYLRRVHAVMDVREHLIGAGSRKQAYALTAEGHRKAQELRIERDKGKHND